MNFVAQILYRSKSKNSPAFHFNNTKPDNLLERLFNLVFMFRSISTIVSTMYIIAIARKHINGALNDIFKFDISHKITQSCTAVMYVFGIGVVGVYDFGTLTPFFIIDNAVIIFAVAYVVLAFLRSLTVSLLSQIIRRCIILKPNTGFFFSYHYFLFAIMPLSADFISSQRIYTMQLYFNLVLTLSAHIAALTHSISKMLHSAFPKVKVVYITGVLCFLGFVFSIPYGMHQDHSICYFVAFTVCLMFLGSQKAAIIMYLYGVQRFATDILFWLGYKPTKYWIITWSVLPIPIAVVLIRWSLNISLNYNIGLKLSGLIWIGFLFVLVVIIQLRTIIKYIAVNKLTGLFRSSYKYGPPDVDDRKRRRKYDEALSLRHCTHNCVVIDDRIDCNHMPVMNMSKTDNTENFKLENSLTQVFEAESHRKPRTSETISADEMVD